MKRNGRRARVVKGMDSKPIVISRAGSSPAVDETFRKCYFCDNILILLSVRSLKFIVSCYQKTKT